MKKIILLALTALMMVGCEYRTDAEIEKAERLNGFDVVVIDSCEYLKNTEIGGYSYFSHKGNCRFCKEYKQKELKELVEQLKEK